MDKKFLWYINNLKWIFLYPVLLNIGIQCAYTTREWHKQTPLLPPLSTSMSKISLIYRGFYLWRLKLTQAFMLPEVDNWNFGLFQDYGFLLSITGGGHAAFNTESVYFCAFGHSWIYDLLWSLLVGESMIGGNALNGPFNLPLSSEIYLHIQ